MSGSFVPLRGLGRVGSIGFRGIAGVLGVVGLVSCSEQKPAPPVIEIVEEAPLDRSAGFSVKLEAVRAITTGNPALGLARYSPDGAVLAVSLENGDGLYVLNPLGGGLTMLTQDEGAGVYARWDSSGRFLSYAARVAHGARTFEVTRTGLRRAAASDPRVARHPSVRLRAEVRDHLVWVIDEGAAKEASTAEVTASPFGDRFFSPAFSPRGTYLTFSGRESGLWIYEVETARLANLGPGSHPVWLAEESGIIYDVIDDDGEGRILASLWHYDMASRARVRLTPADGSAHLRASVSPDGTTVVWDNVGRIMAAKLLVTPKKGAKAGAEAGREAGKATTGF